MSKIQEYTSRKEAADSAREWVRDAERAEDQPVSVALSFVRDWREDRELTMMVVRVWLVPGVPARFGEHVGRALVGMLPEACRIALDRMDADAEQARIAARDEALEVLGKVGE